MSLSLRAQTQKKVGFLKITENANNLLNKNVWFSSDFQSKHPIFQQTSLHLKTKFKWKNINHLIINVKQKSVISAR